MVTVIFATFNGAHTLPRMLDSLRRTARDRIPWEIVAVDNGSTDNTLDILRSFETKLPLQIVREQRRGKNRALNSGLRFATGDLIVLTDDDIIADASWLSEIAEGAERHPGISVFGGAITPHWEAEPPAWLLDCVPLGLTYGITNPNLEEGKVHEGLVWGANMAVRRHVFDEGLRFNEDVGPACGQYIMGSETDFNHRAAALGHEFAFLPSARVRHIIRPHQIDQTWVLDRAFRWGRGVRNREQLSAAAPVAMMAGVPRWLIRQYLKHAIMAWVLGALGRVNEALVHRWETRLLEGYAHQARRVAQLPQGRRGSA